MVKHDRKAAYIIRKKKHEKETRQRLGCRAVGVLFRAGFLSCFICAYTWTAVLRRFAFGIRTRKAKRDNVGRVVGAFVNVWSCDYGTRLALVGLFGHGVIPPCNRIGL